MKEFKGLPGIDKRLLETYPVEISEELDDLVDEVAAIYNLDRKIIKKIISATFKEIRNSIINQEEVKIYPLGVFTLTNKSRLAFKRSSKLNKKTQEAFENENI